MALNLGRNLRDNIVPKSYLIRNWICKISGKLAPASAPSWAVLPTSVHSLARQLDLLGKSLLHIVHSPRDLSLLDSRMAALCWACLEAAHPHNEHHPLGQASWESQDPWGSRETQRWRGRPCFLQGGWWGSRAAPRRSRAVFPVSGSSIGAECPSSPGQAISYQAPPTWFSFVSSQSMAGGPSRWPLESECSVLGPTPWWADVQARRPWFPWSRCSANRPAETGLTAALWRQASLRASKLQTFPEEP